MKYLGIDIFLIYIYIYDFYKVHVMHRLNLLTYQSIKLDKELLCVIQNYN
jgi:hypothetical protein